jgi:hypothetical protein
MKRIKNLIKLTQLNSESLNEKELNRVSAGHFCGCFYENCGGSSTSGNDAANEKNNLYSVVREIPAEWG